MRSATVFFSRRQAMRPAPAPRHADASSRRANGEAGRSMRRDPAARDRTARPLTRSPLAHAYRPRRVRSRREMLVPRGFVPLRTH